MTLFRYAIPFLILGLSACSSMAPTPPEIVIAPTAKPAQPAPPAEASNPVERKDSTPEKAQPPAKAERPAKKATSTQAPSPSSPAVLALLQEAEASSASGSLDEAAATLERAIRIQPRNGQLWHNLAEVRLKQHQPGLAEDLAKKSNVLCQDNKALVRSNWSLIADARRKKGDAEGAAEADAKAGR